MARIPEESVMAAKVLIKTGESVRSVARRLGVSESGLRYRLGMGVKGRPGPGRRRQAEAVEPFLEQVTAWVAAYEAARKAGKRYESVGALYEALVEQGFTGSYRSVTRAVARRVGPRPIKPWRRIEVKPGSQGQVDWIERTARIGGELVKVYGFLLVLGFSRAWALVWSPRMDFASWIHCHHEALRRLGGVPWTLRIDNLKTGVKQGAGPWAVLHDGYDSWAREVGTTIDPARVRTPRDKGKVERKGGDAAVYLDLDAAYLDLEHLQAATDAAVAKRQQKLTCALTGTSIAVAHERERAHLLPLPASWPEPFDVEVRRTVDVSGLVRFEEHEYHVPLPWIGREVTVRGCGDEVVIRGGFEELARYPRHTECLRLIDQELYDVEGTARVDPATPLGQVGRQIVLPRSWEHTASGRGIEAYESLVAAGGES